MPLSLSQVLRYFKQNTSIFSCIYSFLSHNLSFYTNSHLVTRYDLCIVFFTKHFLFFPIHDYCEKWEDLSFCYWSFLGKSFHLFGLDLTIGKSFHLFGLDLTIGWEEAHLLHLSFVRCGGILFSV